MQLTDVWLDANEGPSPDLEWLDGVSADTLRAYPDTDALVADLAAANGVQPSQVLVTAGSDDALDRACRVSLGPGLDAIVPLPCFFAMKNWIGQTGARIVPVPWQQGGFPTEQVIAQVTPRTRMVVITSPNNPTGAVASPDDLVRLSRAAPQALLVVDLAYGEFADEDLTAHALALPNTLVTRTISKAWGLAGLRVGYALGPGTLIQALGRTGLAYPVSGPSIAVARAALRESWRLQAHVEQVRVERGRLVQALRAAGARPQPSQANFVLSRVSDARWWRDALAALGIHIRTFEGRPGLEDAVSISCPGDPAILGRVEAALRTLARPRRVVAEAGIASCWTLPEGLGCLASVERDTSTWALVRSLEGLATARANGALPLAVNGEPMEGEALVRRGAARHLEDPSELARLWRQAHHAEETA